MEEKHLDDVQEISELSIRNYWSKEELSKEIDNKLARYFVHEEDNRIVGFVGVWVVCDEGQITNVAVHPDYRRRGIAKMLMTNMINHLKTLDCSIITLEVRKSNTKAYELYTSLGFTDEGLRRRFYKDGEDAIIMWYRYEDFED